MPIRPENKGRYPKNWKTEIRPAILARANNCCEKEGCGAKNYEPHPVTGSKVVLTIAHLDHTPENCDPSNLRAWCQKCHNAYDAPFRAKQQNPRQFIAEMNASRRNICLLYVGKFPMKVDTL